MKNELLEKAICNVRDTVQIALLHTHPHKALVVYDNEHELTKILTAAYREVLPEAEFLHFPDFTKEEIIAAFDALTPRDLVVLIQTTDFRLNEFRIRIHLFKQKLKVIDHSHLYRAMDQDALETYIHALTYDQDWYRTTGKALKATLEATDTITLKAGDLNCTFVGGVETPKLNVGDYTGMENIGGTFPIGEVFTEAKQLENTNGSLQIFAFAGMDFMISLYDPFRIDIKDGIVTGWSTNTPQAFIDVYEMVRAYERPLIRELGFGLNRAITREHYLKDITAFERMLGLHVSMGEKHTVFKKAGITADKTRYHVDLFPVIDSVQADGITIFENNTYLLN